MKSLNRILLIFLLAWIHALAFAADEKPNVIFILTDNHGAWTLGCYGNEDIQTPNIDLKGQNWNIEGLSYGASSSFQKS